MQRLLTILTFYKPFIAWSFGINVILGFMNTHFIPAIVSKVFLTVFLWYYITESHAKRKLTFYKNLGFSEFKLFSSLFLIDIIITIGFLTLFKEFT